MSTILFRKKSVFDQGKRIICWIGLDGSGKSTCSAMAAEWLQRVGLRTRELWGAYDSFLLLPLIRLYKKILLGRNANPYSDYSSYHEQIASKARSPAVTVYRCALFVEYFVQLHFKLARPRLFGWWAVCDRYVIDTTIHIAANLRLPVDEHVALLERWMKFFPDPALICWVDVPVDVSMVRKDDIPSPQYIEIRRPYYENLARAWPRIVKLDGTKPLDKMRADVESWMEQTVGRA